MKIPDRVLNSKEFKDLKNIGVLDNDVSLEGVLSLLLNEHIRANACNNELQKQIEHFDKEFIAWGGRVNILKKENRKKIKWVEREYLKIIEKQKETINNLKKPMESLQKERLISTAKYAGSSVTLGTALVSILIFFFPNLNEIQEALSAIAIFFINMALVYSGVISKD